MNFLSKVKAKASQLSKSKFCLGVQCLKALYFKVNNPELVAPVDAAQQMIFDQGTAVGIEARKCYPGGILIESDYQHTKEALEHTAKALAIKPTAIFEAALIFDQTLVRIDILKNNGDGTWDLVEVKSSTDLKDEHIFDIAVQKYVAEGAGLKISRSILKHLNRKSVFPDLTNLFVDVDCTTRVEAELELVPSLIQKMLMTLAREAAPAVEIGPHCDTPYECSFKSQCWDHIPEHSVFELNGVWAKDKFELYERGIILIKDISENEKVSRAKPQQLKAVRSNKPVCDPDGLQTFIKKLKYPIYFFDFETLNPAIPSYPGLRPYSQLPFQYSCHVLNKKSSELKHMEYLADGLTDPRPEIAKQMLNVLGTEGTILAFNDSFEKSRISELAEALPAMKNDLLALLPRFVDLKDAFSKNYYHPEFHGSFSIKDILPVLVPSMSYEGLSVSDGGGAQVAYLKLCDPKTTTKERIMVRKELLEYCRQDTFAMVELLVQLEYFVKKNQGDE